MTAAIYLFMVYLLILPVAQTVQCIYWYCQ